MNEDRNFSERCWLSAIKRRYGKADSQKGKKGQISIFPFYALLRGVVLIAFFHDLFKVQFDLPLIINVFGF